MNKVEAAQVLAVLKAAYPQVKIDNAEATAKVWAWTLSDYSAEAVLNAARLHITTSKFWPNPADIREKIVKAQIVYIDTDVKPEKLQAGTDQKQIAAKSSTIKWTDERIQALWEELGGN